MRRLIGGVAGPVAAGAIAVLARVTNGRKLRTLSKRERKDLEGVVPGLDLTRVRVAEGCRLPLLPEFVAITLGRVIYVRGHLARRPATLLAHELAHVRQFTENGLARHDGRLRNALAAARLRKAPDGSSRLVRPTKRLRGEVARQAEVRTG